MQQTKQLLVVQGGIKNPTVADILSYRWDEYTKTHDVRPITEHEVGKTLNCRSGNVFIYTCQDCGESIYQLLGCNSRLCSRCGKRYNDQWAKSLSKSMFPVPHRHFVLSIPSQLWPYLNQDRTLWKPYMDSAIDTCNDYFPKIMHNPHIKPGAIVILHPFGKDMKFQPHLHVIVTEGGFDQKGNFIKKKHFPARNFARSWQYHVSDKLQKAGIPNKVFTELYAKYNGFYVWVHKAGRIKHPKQIAKYLGRYVRHPAISNSRITSLDTKSNTVEFYYEQEDEYNNKTRHYVTMHVDKFITSLIQHIPDKQFKMIRYYGTYSRRRNKVFRTHASQSSITNIKNNIQDTLYMPGRKFKPICPLCGGFLKFSSYETIPPPGDYFHWDVPMKKMAKWSIRN